MEYLDRINKPNDIKNIEPEALPELADEIREFLVRKVSVTGGHLASNLGTVELTMALHLCMDFPKDKLILDVGHQCYTHKILTGRKDGFDNLRMQGGISGFPKTSESDCDAFETGHSSTSISAAMGFMKAREINNTNEKICAVIGDGSMTGGMFYEAINQISQFKSNLVIVLNDNEMSISKNVGSMSRALTRLRVGESYNDLKSNVESAIINIPDVGMKMAKGIKKSKDTIRNFFIPGLFVEELGVTYVGPVDGHNIPELKRTLTQAFRLNRPIIVHVKTVKGKGYSFAEKHPTYFHGVGPFDINTGKALSGKTVPTYTDAFAKNLVRIGAENEKVVAVIAAMSRGTGVHSFKKKFPERTIDVGIAEEHAVTFAAGMAKQGVIPVVAIYSSFLQRAYDQILHDVCLQNLHVIFAIDRSGIVPGDGETHQGIYDTAYLSDMPNLTIISPMNEKEMALAMDFAVAADGPVAIKYCKGNVYRGYKNVDPFEKGKSVVLIEGDNFSENGDKSKEDKNKVDKKNYDKNNDGGVTVIAVGNMVETSSKLCELIKKDLSINPTLINARFIKPMDKELIIKAGRSSRLLVVVEEAVEAGSFGNEIAGLLFKEHINTEFMHFCIEDEILPHGTVSELRSLEGLTPEKMLEKIKEEL